MLVNSDVYTQPWSGRWAGSSSSSVLTPVVLRVYVLPQDDGGRKMLM